MYAEEPKRHCKFYVERKKRYCRFELAEGAEYCKVHDESSNNRVPCPYEKGTFIIADQLYKHLLICPKYKEQKLKENSVWYDKSVNKVKAEVENIVQDVDIKKMYTEKYEQFLRFLSRLPKFYFDVFEKDDKGPFYYIDLVEKDFDMLPYNSHNLQSIYLTDLMKEYNLLRPEYIFVEFGAGRGLLSYTVALEMKKMNKISKHILLERYARRNKYDRFVKDNPYFQRFRGDVEDFSLGDSRNIMLENAKSNKKVPVNIEYVQKELEGVKGLVGICKHMCGKATDLSLYALQHASKTFTIKGTVMATCCHQLCSSDSFGNLTFFYKIGMYKMEIEWMFRVSSWGTRHTPPTGYTFKTTKYYLVTSLEKDALLGLLSYEQKYTLGKMCKRIIDRARTYITIKMGLKVQMVRYCSRYTSPENFAIVSYE